MDLQAGSHSKGAEAPEARGPFFRRLADGWRHAFRLDGPHGPLTEEDRELLDRLARAIVKRRMSEPAILFLSSLRPVNYIGSQAIVFLRPFLTFLFNAEEAERLTNILERREGIGALVDAIEGAS